MASFEGSQERLRTRNISSAVQERQRRSKGKRSAENNVKLSALCERHVSTPSLTGLDSSAFRRLPAELRNEIYELVLLQDDSIMISVDYRWKKLQTTSFNNSDHKLALLSVCKQLNIECTPIFYGTNTFKFMFQVEYPEHHNGIRLFDLFTASLGRLAQSSLRNIEITIQRRTTEAQYLNVGLDMMRDVMILHKRDIFASSKMAIKYTLDFRTISWLYLCDFKITVWIHNLEHDLARTVAELKEGELVYSRKGEEFIDSLQSSLNIIRRQKGSEVAARLG